ncbi:methyl-accepting chemotaxis protein [Pantanalinema rosaneae CENA516]|uniref:methyl-accepting chemotaxis protein n=1 Tax=Pantanalinema rosaneae TaxID=1620701 RepID=UPI003D6F04C1
MFNNSNLKIRILFGYSLPILCLVGLGAIVYTSALSTFERQEAVETAQIIIGGINEMTFGMGTMVRNVRGYVLFPNDKSYLKSYENGLQVFQSGSTQLSQLRQDPYLKTQLAFFNTHWTEIQGRADQIFALVEQRKLNEAKELLSSLRMLEAEARRQEIVAQQTQLLAQKNQEEADARHLMLLLVLGGTAVSTVFVVLVGLWVSHAIAAPLGRKINQVVHTAECISVGDLTTPIEITVADSQEITKLLMAFRSMTHHLNTLICQVQQSGIQVTSSTTQIAASGKQLEATLNEQVAATTQVVATAKEIATTASELARVMEEIAATAQSTTAAADAGQQGLLQIAGTMQQLSASTTAISSKLGTISERANNINTIVTTIAKVADQTNLLSLNAAIEAEKAGEHGLGFGVVAREIRRLADQTAVATLDIEQMVKAMQSAVSTGVMEMDKFARQVDRGVEDIDTISTQITQVIEQVQTLTPQFTQVNYGMEMQSQGAQQISEAMMQLKESSGQTAASLNETNTVITQLSHVAQGLQTAISRFKIHTDNLQQL